MDRLREFLSTPLLNLSGFEVTPGRVLALLGFLFAAGLAGRLANRGTRRLVMRRTDDEGTAYAAGRVVQYLVFVVGILIGLENVGVELSTLAAAGAVLMVGLGFGLQNIAQNFISGLILLLERPVKIGDVVIVDGTYGIVDKITIRATHIMTFDQVAMIVPNSKLISEVVENRSFPTTVYRTAVEVGVAYGTDTELVERVLLDVGNNDDNVLSDPAPIVFFIGFGSSSLDFRLCVWLDDPLSAMRIMSNLRHEIAKQFKKADIEIPFPQRDLHVRSVDRPAVEAITPLAMRGNLTEVAS